MHGCNDLGVRELPDVHVMARQYIRQRLNVVANLLELKILRRSLQEDLRGGEGEREGGFENDDGNEERHGRIGVVLARPVGQPDDQSGDDDADISEGVAKHVENHGIHTHVAVIVSVAGRAFLARLVVVVGVVQA